MAKKRTVDWHESTTTSHDGTTIGFLTTGQGPGLLVIPGTFRRAHHYAALAANLAHTHTVHVLSRRGRAPSGPQGPDYTLDRDVDDALAVLDHTGTDLVFGHSYGGLIALHVALRRTLAALVAYEPAVSMDGSFDSSWISAFTGRVTVGQSTGALALFLKRTRMLPFTDAPMPVFHAVAALVLAGRDGRANRALLPTLPAELREVVRLDSDSARYAVISSPTLLLAGDKSPAYLTGILPELSRIIPDATHRLIAGLDHNAPDLNAPSTIADQIRAFTTLTRAQATP